LKRCHALTVRKYILKRARQQLAPGQKKVSQPVLQQAQQAKEAILHDSHITAETLCHVLLWDQAVLVQTCDDALIASVVSDWTWLRKVWVDLFGSKTNMDSPTQGPLVSWESWLWAHAIVRSRAIGLLHPTLLPKGVISAQTSDGLVSVEGKGVLIPLIDMINHSSDDSNTRLDLRPEGVAVIATKSLEAGEEVLFNYHPDSCTLRFLLRSYGFVDRCSNFKQQIFEAKGTNFKIDITSTNSGIIRVAGIQIDDGNGALLLRLTDEAETEQTSRRSSQECLLLNDDIESLSHTNLWAANLCRYVLEDFLEKRQSQSIEGATDSQPSDTDSAAAHAYFECNLVLLRKSIQGLEDIGKLTSIRT
jgi:hypothetical protein